MFDLPGFSLEAKCSICGRTEMDKLTHGKQEEFCKEEFCPLLGKSRRKEMRRAVDRREQ